MTSRKVACGLTRFDANQCLQLSDQFDFQVRSSSDERNVTCPPRPAYIHQLLIGFSQVAAITFFGPSCRMRYTRDKDEYILGTA